LFHFFQGLSIVFWVEEAGGDGFGGDASRCSDTLSVASRIFREIRRQKLTRKELGSHVARCRYNGGDHYDVRWNGSCLDQEVSHAGVFPERRLVAESVAAGVGPFCRKGPGMLMLAGCIAGRNRCEADRQ
jgi:hypothetical protein